MIMALENHLDALLTMERKMLEGGDLPAWTPQTVDRFNSADGKAVADWMRELERVKAPMPNSNDNAQEPPSLSPFQWMAGDKVVFVGSGEPGFTKGKAYVIEGIDALAGSLRIIDDIGNVREIFSHNWIAANLRNYSKRGEQAQPAPDVIDMTDPRNWQVGDVVVGKDRLMTSYGKEFIVAAIDGNEVSLSDGKGNVLRLFHARDYFKWLRHGEVQS